MVENDQVKCYYRFLPGEIVDIADCTNSPCALLRHAEQGKNHLSQLDWPGEGLA